LLGIAMLVAAWARALNPRITSELADQSDERESSRS
jgi:hypothetical protein